MCKFFIKVPIEEVLLLKSVSKEKLQAGFHMIADDRGSQIADRRRSQIQLSRTLAFDANQPTWSFFSSYGLREL